MPGKTKTGGNCFKPVNDRGPNMAKKKKGSTWRTAITVLLMAVFKEEV